MTAHISARTSITKACSEIWTLGDVPAARGLTITKVEPVLLSYRFEEPLTWSGGTLAGNTAGFVRISTADGLVGVGETYSSNYAPLVMARLVEHFADYLVGEDASKIGELWSRCWTRSLYWGRLGVSVSVLSAVESALWDLCGKAVGAPAYELLGGAVHDELPQYASGGMGESLDALAAEQRGFTADTYSGSKIRTGFDPETDRARAVAASESLGEDVRLAVDAVQGSNPEPWEAERAIEVGKRLEDLDLLWFEEPCAADDVAGHAACRRALDIPIAGAETLTTLRPFLEFLEADALDVVQPDAAHCGGMLVMRQVAEAAAGRGAEVATHAWGSAGTMMSNYHVAFASPAARWLERPTKANPLVDELLAEPLRVIAGRIQRPTAPGLGLEVTAEHEQRFPFDLDCRYRFDVRRG